MTLTPTKAHDQFMPVLAEIPRSLQKYGHKDITALFTDNVRADKAQLERVLPSLSYDIIPVPVASSLEHLSIPLAWHVSILESTFQINTRLNILMESLECIPESDTINVAVDMEWSVDRSSGIYGRVALLSIAYEKCIYLIRVCIFT